MHPFNSILNQRKSIRRFNHYTLDTHTLNEIILAGATAPSLCNLQPWRYRVVTHNDISTLLPFTPMHFIKDASCIIVCCLDYTTLESVPTRILELASHGILKDTIYESLNPSLIKNSLKDSEYMHRNLYLSIGASINQMCLYAAHIGLGSCIVTLFKDAPIKDTLQLPSSLQVVALLAIGKPSPAELEKMTPKLSPSEILI